MSEQTLTDLVNNVVKWAYDRNIINGSTPAKQLEKLSSEFVELCVAVGKDEAASIHGIRGENSGAVYAEEVMDGIGDTLVVLIIVCEQLGFDIEGCLNMAYEEIKDRKGKMIGGKFVKEADL